MRLLTRTLRIRWLLAGLALTLGVHAATVNNAATGGGGGGADVTVSNTWTAANIYSVAGAASTPGLSVTGVPFAGTGTTSFPQLYVNSNTATASTTMTVGGTGLGVNVHSTNSPDLINLMVDGMSKFKIVNGGGITTAGDFAMASGAGIYNSITQGYLTFNPTPTIIYTIADANPAFQIKKNNTGASGDILQLVGGASGTTIVESTYKDGEKSFKGVTPTATTGCGTGPTIVGNNNVGHITVGTTPGTTCLVTFANSGTGWGANAPVCTCNDDTSAVACRVSANSTTTITLNAVVVAADSLDFICVGYR